MQPGMDQVMATVTAKSPERITVVTHNYTVVLSQEELDLLIEMAEEFYDYASDAASGQRNATAEGIVKAFTDAKDK